MLQNRFGRCCVVALLAADLLLIGSAAPAADIAPILDVPMLQSNKGHPLIEIEFPGAGTVDCVVDTGAMAGVAPKAVLAAVGDHGEMLPSVSAIGANGSISVERIRVSDLHIGAMALPPMTFVQRDLDGLTGPSGQTACVIGQPLLTPYAAEFDGVDQRFRLWSKDDAPTWVAQHRALSTDIQHPMAAFPLHQTPWGDGSILWVLDTGAPFTSINPAARSALGLDQAPAVRQVTRRGLDGSPKEQPVIGIPPARLYAGLREQTEVEVADLPVLMALGIAQDQPGGLIGADIIAGQRLLIDYQGKSVWVAQTGNR
jgi:predicted aspartyl protease